MADATIQNHVNPRADRAVSGKSVAGRLLFIGLGALFGFLLSRAGATTYDFYPKLFLFQDLQLLWVIVTAAGIGFLGNQIYKAVKAKTLISRQIASYTHKPWKKGLVPGSLIFGLGWGLAGACPGTALAMLGEGKLGTLFTILGFFIGTYIHGYFMSRKIRE
ncbi:DUF6691 family protein [Salinispira pacifica]|uniref:Uncharacterized protein n=1 Tax=Salinispira pacifica TaxID=1307761 RepID=V5WLT5_9SPIO|nr:DUF6691 family protein [Salinispira pacifica]AHC16583.1 hypothetical protein L21SP2_3243 [Salinispira pacifica]